MQSRCVIMFLILFYAASAGASPAVAVPFDEETLDEIGELNRAITDHYEQLISRTRTLDAEREASSSRIEAIESDLSEIERERADVERLAPDAEPALRMIEEHRIEAKSRYLEALAEKHVLDLEVMRSFEVHGAAILSNLERLALALEDSGRVEDGSESPGTRSGFRSLQQGTAVALSVLEDWGALTRDDPRFRALWATSRVLNRNLRSLKASDGIRATVELVRERSFVVRSLIDQARAPENLCRMFEGWAAWL